MSEAVKFLLFVLCTAIVTVSPSYGSGGPVFINPANQAAPAPAPAQNQGSLVTQTVYGFLDFTTTIGNTVMVFSPQSAADAGKNKVSEPTVNAVIDTKPVATAAKESPSVIKPSKTEKKAADPSKKISSVVQVQANPPVTLSSKVEIKGGPSTKINIIQGVSSVVHVASAPPIISSKVEVVQAQSTMQTQHNIISKVEVITGAPKHSHVPIISSHVEVYEGPSSSMVTPAAPVITSVVEIVNEEEPALIIGNNIGEPEYDFLSRQPSEVVEETYKVINLKPSSKLHLKPRPSVLQKNKAHPPTKRVDSLHPTGLVTKLGGTVVKDGATTVHETSVIGTYISGKYAQVLQSTSRVLGGNKGKISPSPSLRILKTVAPNLGKHNKHNRHLDPTPAGSINEETLLVAEGLSNNIKSTRKPSPSGSFKRFKNRHREQEPEENEPAPPPPPPPPQQSHKKANRNRQNQTTQRPHKQNTQHRQKFGRNKTQVSTVSVSSEQITPTTSPGSGKRYNSRRNKQAHRSSTPAPESNNNNNNNNNNGGFTRRGYKPKLQASSVDSAQSSSSLYKFKLNRSPGRWQYKTTAKPRVTIRKQNDDDQNETGGTTPNSFQDSSPALNDVVTPQSRSDDVDGLVGSESVAAIIDDESSTENKLDTPFPLETIKVEISTPPDFKDIYYEIATIKSPYTFQVGSVKNTRYITVTSTFEKSLEPDPTIAPTASEPLTENILATTSNYDKDNNFLDSSIATLPPIYLASDMETPPLDTKIDTFSTTQTMLKTHILPVIRGGNNTSSQTLVQTYLITRLVTATKTLPPMEAYHFNPSKTLNEFNSHLDEAGSELHLELDFGDQNDHEDGNGKRVLPGDLDLAIIGSDFDLSDVDKSRLPEGFLMKKVQAPITPKPFVNELVSTPALSPEQLQQLALLRLLNPAAAAQGQVITASKPVVKVETLYESHVIPIVNGGNTFLSTISKIVGTLTKTEYEFVTSTLPGLPIPPVPVNPLFPQQQQQFAFTSSPIVQTTVLTQTQSKILKLTFGAKTAYTTIFSTKVVPTVLTTYMTGSVPVAQTAAAFPGFFPAPYPQFPFVG